MTRRLTFTDDDVSRVRFKRLYEGLLTGASERRSIDALRREGRILDVLDGISEADGAMRKLVGPCALELEQADFAMLEQYVNNTPWLPVVARQIVDLVDWLSAAEKVEPPKA